jgi:glycosyltransferase involved in cell wall biosynthesis
MKDKVLCILHRSPPSHGAAKVGDFISNNELLKKEFNCRFITIKSSNDIGDIGKINIRKFYLVAELYLRVLWAILIFRPNKIYYTSSVQGVAFYRDILISTLWKVYSIFKDVDIYYHYHTKGIDEFVSNSGTKLKLTNYFVKNVNLILLSPLLEKDFEKINTFKKVVFLPNGVENHINDADFYRVIDRKFTSFNSVEILYLSNMIKSKGYFEVLKMVNKTKNHSIHYHFAGGWENAEDEKEFYQFIEENEISDKVTFHGFVSGEKKQQLFQRSHIFVFPTRYHKEAFPLSILEALSYGIPVLTTDEASIPSIIDHQSGFLIKDISSLCDGLRHMQSNLINRGTSIYCRKRYIDNFSLKQFEKNLIKVLKES